MALPPGWKQQQKKHIQLSQKLPMTWPISMIPIAEKPHCMSLDTRPGSTEKYHKNTSDQEAQQQIAWPVHSGQGQLMKCLQAQATFVLWPNSPHLLSQPI